MAATKVKQRGSCHCGAVEFQVEGDVFFNVLCHCNNCCRNRGASPVHVMGVSPPDGVRVTKGEELLIVHQGKQSPHGSCVTRVFCKLCGCVVHQGPKDAGFRGVLPTTFQIDGVLPEELRPTAHWNYENRKYDVQDKLPKVKDFPTPFGTGISMNDAGQVIEERKHRSLAPLSLLLLVPVLLLPAVLLLKRK